MFYLFQAIKKLFTRKRKRTHYTKAQKRKVITMLTKNMSPATISKKTKVNIKTIYNLKLKSGISPRRRKIGIDLTSEIRTAYLKGFSMNATAKLYGININSVFCRFTRWNKDASLFKARLAAMKLNYKKIKND